METNELVLQAKNGSENAFNELCTQYEPLLISMANKHSIKCGKEGMFDEFLQEAKIALHKAILSYDLNKGTASFGSYASSVIHNRLVDLTRRMNSKKRKNADVDSIGEEIAGGDAPQDEVVWRELGEKLMKKVEKQLSPYERKVLSMLISGHKAKEISLQIGEDVKSVYNAIFRIRSKLKGIY